MTARDPVARALEEFLRRRSQGEALDAEDYLRQNPGLAPALRAHLALAHDLRQAFRTDDPPPVRPGAGASLPAPRAPLGGRSRRLGPFRLLDHLGSGSMGSVYRGEVVVRVADLEPGASVALKLLEPRLLASGDLLARFRREARIGRRLPGATGGASALARTHCSGHALLRGERVHYLAMELVPGEDLGARLCREGRQPEAFVRTLASGVARGLVELVEAGVVHRDLKPTNVMVLPDGGIKLLDFGLAALLNPMATLTRSGTFVGAVRYAAPEQLSRRRGAVDGRTDLYALGLLLYETWVGELPWPDEHLTLAFRRRAEARPPDPLAARPGLAPNLATAIRRLLEPDPAKRFEHAAALLSHLGALRSDSRS